MPIFRPRSKIKNTGREGMEWRGDVEWRGSVYHVEGGAGTKLGQIGRSIGQLQRSSDVQGESVQLDKSAGQTWTIWQFPTSLNRYTLDPHCSRRC